MVMLNSLPAADGRGIGLSEMDRRLVYLVYARAIWNRKRKGQEASSGYQDASEQGWED